MSTQTQLSTRTGLVTFDGGPAQVVCVAGETILLAGLRAGLRLPYECASGGCGSCKARLVEGTVTSRWDDASGLTERDRRRGDRILLCQSIPDGAVAVRTTGELTEHGEPVPARQIGRLASRVQLNDDTALFGIELTQPLGHLAGQFVQLESPQGVRRAFSMTQPHSDSGRIELLIRDKPGGAASAWLFDTLAVGDALMVEGPYGRAYARTPPGGRAVCLGGGTGAAPVLAIATQLMAEDRGRDLTVYLGGRTLADLVPVHRVLALREAGARVVLAADAGSSSGADSEQHDELGTVHLGFALARLVAEQPDLSTSDLYLGGPAPMIDAALRALVREGTARADRVFLDRFV